MATPSSSSSSGPDHVTAQPSAASSASDAAAFPPRSSVPSSMSPTLPVPRRAPIFVAQPLLGKPLNPLPPHQGVLFSAGTANRGFQSRAAAVRPQPSDQTVTVANPAGYIRNINPTAAMTLTPTARPIVFSSDHTSQMHPPVHVMRPPQPQPSPQFVAPRQVGASGGASGPPKGVPIVSQPKVSSFQTIASTLDYNNCKDRDKSKEDSFVTVYNRKVRLLDDGPTSLYALCRSWLRNGYPQETQPNFGDGAKLLPRPLPASDVDTDPSEKIGGDNEVEDPQKEELVGSGDQLSTRDLLEGLKKRSKSVRAQLKKERLRRIARYKHRLSLLVPPTPSEGRSDAATPRS